MLGNFSGADVRADVEGWDDAELLLGNYPDAVHPCGKADVGALRPWEARVHRRLV